MNLLIRKSDSNEPLTWYKEGGIVVFICKCGFHFHLNKVQRCHPEWTIEDDGTVTPSVRHDKQMGWITCEFSEYIRLLDWEGND